MKIKLKDLTFEQYKKWSIKCNPSCKDCLFNKVNCSCASPLCWILNKDIYSEKFLNQEIEIEDVLILDNVEKKYLEAVLRPFKDRITSIHKASYAKGFEQIVVIIKPLPYKCFSENIMFPAFEENTMYKSMEIEKRYTLKELKLFESTDKTK